MITSTEIRAFADRLDKERDDLPRHLAGDIAAAVIQLHYIAATLEKEYGIPIAGQEDPGPTADH